MLDVDAASRHRSGKVDVGEHGDDGVRHDAGEHDILPYTVKVSEVAHSPRAGPNEVEECDEKEVL